MRCSSKRCLGTIAAYSPAEVFFEEGKGKAGGLQAQWHRPQPFGGHGGALGAGRPFESPGTREETFTTVPNASL